MKYLKYLTNRVAAYFYFKSISEYSLRKAIKRVESKENSTPSKKYYFVSFTHKDGYGNAFIEAKNEFDDEPRISPIQDNIQNSNSIKDVIISHFTEIDKKTYCNNSGIPCKKHNTKIYQKNKK